LKAGTESEIESAVVAAVQQQANALSIAADAYLNSRSRQIASFALRHALPTTGESRETVAAGLLISYGPNQADSFRQVGLYVGRILKGENPADLPVLQPTKFELVINLTTAKAMYRLGGLGDAERTRKYAAELIALAPDVIFASGTAQVGPLLQATRTV